MNKLISEIIITLKSSATGRKLIIILSVKLIIIFIILKVFFFQDFLDSKYDNKKEKSNHVLNSLTKQ